MTRPTRPKRSPVKFEERIAAQKVRLEAQVACLPYGPERYALQRKIKNYRRFGP
jgi:hypothetical protein